MELVSVRVCVCALLFFVEFDNELKALKVREHIVNYPDFSKQENSKSTTFHLITFLSK